MEKIQKIRVVQIVRWDNDRIEFDEQGLQELAESIQKNGMAQPPTLRLFPRHLLERLKERLFSDDQEVDLDLPIYEVVAGERRTRAVRLLGWTQMPAIVRVLDDAAAKDIMLIENINRADLKPIEEARAYRRRVESSGLGEEEALSMLVEKTGKSREYIRGRMALLALAPEIQTLVQSGSLPIGHAQLIAPLPVELQRSAVRILTSSKVALSQAAFAGVVAKLRATEDQQSLFDLESFFVTELQRAEAVVLSGKKAVVSVPVSKEAPEVPYHSNFSTGEVIVNYIGILEQMGMEDAAGVVGKLYEHLLYYNWVRIPRTEVLSA